MHTVNKQLSVMKRTFLHFISNIKTKQLFLVTLQMLKNGQIFYLQLVHQLFVQSLLEKFFAHVRHGALQ